MPNLKQGQIILAEMLDPQGRNPKTRPVVIVTPANELEAGELFQAVAITGTLPAPLPSDYVLRPYHNRGHPRTGLRRKSAAVCSWLVEISEHDIVQHKGIVPAKQLKAILDILEQLQ